MSVLGGWNANTYKPGPNEDVRVDLLPSGLNRLLDFLGTQTFFLGYLTRKV